MSALATARPSGGNLLPDPWLQSLLGRPCFTLRRLSTAAVLPVDPPVGPCFVSAKVPVAPLDDSLALQDSGFRVVDTALTFEASDLQAGNDRRIRLARPDDRPAVGAIAARSFKTSRFHLDPTIPNETANRIKSAWAENYFTGRRGDLMLIAEQDGEVAGFLQALRSSTGTLVIDLLAVAEAAARRGFARAMIERLAAEADSQQATALHVGTQAANLPSCRLYESLGFRLVDAKAVLHFHGGED